MYIDLLIRSTELRRKFGRCSSELYARILITNENTLVAGEIFLSLNIAKKKLKDTNINFYFKLTTVYSEKTFRLEHLKFFSMSQAYSFSY